MLHELTALPAKSGTKDTECAEMNYPAAGGGVSKRVCYLFYRSKLRGITSYRFRIVLQMIRVIRVICEICGLKCDRADVLVFPIRTLSPFCNLYNLW